jgi:hypothetical protein
MEDNGLAVAPVLIEDLDPIFGSHRTHGLDTFSALDLIFLRWHAAMVALKLSSVTSGRLPCRQ